MTSSKWHKMEISGVVTGNESLTIFPTSGEEGLLKGLLQPRIRLKSPPFATNMPPPKTTFVALFLLTVGFGFLLSGIFVYFADLRAESDRGLAMAFLGLLMLTPGSYASFILFGAFQGWSGYYYWQIPSYDDID